MNTHRIPKSGATALVLSLALGFAAASPARAGPLIANGGFEGGFASWTRVDQLGSDGTFALQSGILSPVNLDPVPAPPGGLRAAMTDAQGPGSHVLYQDFVVPTQPIGNAQLRFDLFVGNRAAAFANPNPASLDFSTPALNQQARVDILRGGTDPFSVAAADVLFTAYQTNLGDPLVSGYTPITRDLSALLAANAGQTLRLRFAETDNVFTFQLGVDNVTLDAAIVPEPASVAAVGVAVGVLALRLRRRSTT